MLERFAEWYSKPYSQDMSVNRWFLFLGLVSLLSFIWVRVLRSIANNI